MWPWRVLERGSAAELRAARPSAALSAGDKNPPAQDHRGIRPILHGELLVPQVAGGGTETSNASHAHRGVWLSSVTNIAWRSNLVHLVLGYSVLGASLDRSYLLRHLVPAARLLSVSA